ncbi:MAG: exodeoxyribonuclease V subunit alpha [Gammaproteobacteria bacterium]
MMREALQAAVGLGALRAVDLHFGRRLAALAGGDDPLLWLAGALASQRLGEGDVCVDLTQCQDFPLFQVQMPGGCLAAPEPRLWIEALRRSPVVGRPGERAPLILDEAGRLYLGRYWYFEQVVAAALTARTGRWAVDVDRERLRQGLAEWFPKSRGPDPGEGTDWQQVAAALALLRPFCVISGGPGTGKTRTVTAILALLVQQANGEALRIVLAAPTGKAAARLTESIRAQKRGLPLTPEQVACIPEAAQTLHRLLGFRPGRANPRHGPDHPLHLDVLVVDEASMVDLPLMARLLAALPEHARLILLGDKDQLASVEAGRVLGDICGRGAKPAYSSALCAAVQDVTGTALASIGESVPAMAEHLVVLQKSWRFEEQSGIGALARAVNAGDMQEALAILGGGYPDVKHLASEPSSLHAYIVEQVVPAHRKVMAAPTPEAALAALNAMRVLCAVREGPYGVQALNRVIEQTLFKAGLIRRSGDLYAGRPVMVTVNDHAQRLYNGDVGLVLPDPEGGGLRVFLETAEGVRRLLPSRLPPHETVYAMTVHKSQGSEFEKVLLILPDVESRVITRELLYTGITRAKRKVTLRASGERFTQAIERPVRRSTGLYVALWGEATRR